MNILPDLYVVCSQCHGARYNRQTLQVRYRGKSIADILGMSALLTTTMPYMKVVIDALVDKGLREKYIVMVGGAPLNEEFGEAIGADAYCRDAAEASSTAVRLVNERRAAAQ